MTRCAVLHSPGYASLEYLEGEPRRRSDVYAIAAVLKYAATGVHPYCENGFNLQKINFAISRGKPMVKPGSIQPPELEEVIRKATECNADDRLSLKELIRELTRILPTVLDLGEPSLLKAPAGRTPPARGGTRADGGRHGVPGPLDREQLRNEEERHNLDTLVTLVSARKEPARGRFLGVAFDTFNHEQPTRKITAITVHSGHWIDGIEVEYDNKQAQVVRHGTYHPNSVKLKQRFVIKDGEYLQKITGRLGGQYVHQLQFHTTGGPDSDSKRYGETRGDYDFVLGGQRGTIISGVHGSVWYNDGRGAAYVEALGVYIAPAPQ